jgi:hypothetical protein
MANVYWSHMPRTTLNIFCVLTHLIFTTLYDYLHFKEEETGGTEWPQWSPS